MVQWLKDSTFSVQGAWFDSWSGIEIPHDAAKTGRVKQIFFKVTIYIICRGKNFNNNGTKSKKGVMELNGCKILELFRKQQKVLI